MQWIKYLPLLLLLVSTSSAALPFLPIGSSNGLDARVVPSLLIDRNGFLWVGAREGLYRYDGYRARVFLPNVEDPGAISDHDIRDLYESEDGALWIATNAGGLNRMDPVSGEFRKFVHNSADPASIIDDSIYGVSEGPDGQIWASSSKGLSRLDLDSGEFTHFSHDPDDPGSLSHHWAFRLYRGPGGTLWISTVGGGLNRWNPETESFDRFDLAALAGGPAALNDAFALHETPEGAVYVGTRSGLVLLRPGLNQAQQVDLGLIDGTPPIITSMEVDSSGRLWLSTMVRGVLLLDLETHAWESTNPEPLGSETNLPAQAQMTLTLSDDSVFVGTWGSGVYRAPLYTPEFLLLSQANTAQRLRTTTVTAVMASEEIGAPWVGTFGGGVQNVRIEPRQVLESGTTSEQFRLAGILTMARVDETIRLAAGTLGLFVFNDLGDEIQHVPNDTGEPGHLGEGYVYALAANGDGTAWVGLMGSGVWLWDPANGVSPILQHDPDDAASISSNYVSSLALNGDSHLWVGTRSNGLNLCHLDSRSCERFGDEASTTNPLGDTNITDLYRDRRGRLWVGSDGGGLSRINQDANGQVMGIDRWSRDDGLLDNGIMAIEEDLDESLWLGTRQGLNRFNPKTGEIVGFVRESGLPTSRFNGQASAADSDFIYFGSVDGLLSIRKGSLLAERKPAPIRLTSIQRTPRGQPNVALPLRESIEIPFGDVLALEFAVLDFAEAAHEYAYRVQADDDWIQIGSQRQVIFHGLSPGHYEFEVRGRDIHGSWGQSSPLSVEVVPPFWREAWFRILVLVTLVLLALLAHRASSRAIVNRARRIQMLGERREKALEEALGSEAELAVLTPRQKEILQLVAEGYTTREIADLLGVSVKTVENHRANLMERLEIYDVPGLVKLAIRSRLVSAHS